MKTVKVNTNELTGKALDWALGVATGKTPTLWQAGADDKPAIIVEGSGINTEWAPTTKWAQLGPLAFSLGISFMSRLNRDGSYYYHTQKGPEEPENDTLQTDDDPMVSACRSIVSAHSGQTVDVPEVLL